MRRHQPSQEGQQAPQGDGWHIGWHLLRDDQMVNWRWWWSSSLFGHPKWTLHQGFTFKAVISTTLGPDCPRLQAFAKRHMVFNIPLLHSTFRALICRPIASNKTLVFSAWHTRLPCGTWIHGLGNSAALRPVDSLMSLGWCWQRNLEAFKIGIWSSVSAGYSFNQIIW